MFAILYENNNYKPYIPYIKYIMLITHIILQAFLNSIIIYLANL